MQVTIRQFVKDFRGLINQQVGTNSLKIGKGQCASLEDYKRQCGFNDGLNAAAELADNMLRQLEEAERDQDLPEMPPHDGKKAAKK